MPIPDTNILRNAIPQSNFNSSQLPTIPDPNSIDNNFLENSFDKTNLDLERIKSDYKSITGVGGLIGDILSSDMTKTLGSSIIGKAFNLIQENKNVQYFTYRI